jgi:hypothetical protein
MSALGLRGVPRADVAIFADTQSEPYWVYDQVEVMKAFAAKHGVEFKVVSKGNLAVDVRTRATAPKEGDEPSEGRFASVPLFVHGRDGRASPSRRQCTKEYKIEPIERAIREHLGYKPRQHVKHRVRALIGISWDERSRCKTSQTKWVTNVYPLVELRISVAGCQDLLKHAGLPVPRKSACVFCPYHDDAHWARVKAEEPEVFAQACDFDEAMRDQSASGLESEAFVHRSLTPLRMAEFRPEEDPRANPAFGLFDSFANECDGMCGV